MAEGFDMGRFQGMVIERLDHLGQLGNKMERCLDLHDSRLDVLEGQATRLKIYCSAISLALGLFSGKLAGLLKGWVG